MNKQSHIANLIKMAEVDGNISPLEVMFIKGLSLRMDVSNEEFNEIIQNRNNIQFNPPATKEEQYQQLAELIILMNVDLIASPNEKDIIFDVGGKMGISTDKIEEIIQYLSENKLTESTLEKFIAL